MVCNGRELLNHLYTGAYMFELPSHSDQPGSSLSSGGPPAGFSVKSAVQVRLSSSSSPPAVTGSNFFVIKKSPAELVGMG